MMFSRMPIARFVKMTFTDKEVEEFLRLFHQSKDSIRSFPGCLKMELFGDRKSSNIFFTYSVWESEEDLNKYRKSDLFGKVWPKTKLLFSEEAKAWSLDQIDPPPDKNIKAD